MNAELTSIAESKVRQLGGDVCGVLVRKDGKLAAVDEHGRVQWLQSGQGAEPVAWVAPTATGIFYGETAEEAAANAESFGATLAGTIPLYTHPQPAQQGSVPESAPSRDDLVQCLLATRGQSEGVAADAILSLFSATTPQPAQQGSIPEGWKLVPVEPTTEMRYAYHEAYQRYLEGSIPSPDGQWWAMLDAAPQPEGDGWVSSFERAPTKSDADFSDRVIWWEATDDTLQEFRPVVAHYDPNWWEGGYCEDFRKDIAPSHPFWKPTGLKRPQPPKEGGADDH